MSTLIKNINTAREEHYRTYKQSARTVHVLPATLVELNKQLESDLHVHNQKLVSRSEQPQLLELETYTELKYSSYLAGMLIKLTDNPSKDLQVG